MAALMSSSRGRAATRLTGSAASQRWTIGPSARE